jgi:glycine cleavage system aminomethyltransferase T
VNRHLSGLRCASLEPPPTGARVFQGDQDVGEVRSAVASPRLGGIALAMIRREAGASLIARWDGGERAADLVPLPFPA